MLWRNTGNGRYLFETFKQVYPTAVFLVNPFSKHPVVEHIEGRRRVFNEGVSRCLCSYMARRYFIRFRGVAWDRRLKESFHISVIPYLTVAVPQVLVMSRVEILSNVGNLFPMALHQGVEPPND